MLPYSLHLLCLTGRNYQWLIEIEIASSQLLVLIMLRPESRIISYIIQASLLVLVAGLTSSSLVLELTTGLLDQSSFVNECTLCY